MPDMKEKLVECYLRSIDQCLNTKCRDCEYFPEPQKPKRRCQAAMVVDDLIANGVTVQEWISVKDRLPEECGFYICFFQSPYGNGCWRVGQCHWNEESWVRIGAVPPHVIVTHWMPLPQPPKGE